MRTLLAILAVAALLGCSAGPLADAAGSADRPLSLLLVGDTGYHYDWLEAEELAAPLGVREFVIEELDDWLEDARPIDAFKLPPMHRLAQTGGFVMASGMWPVADAALRWCEPAERCHAGIMLGDNIYPAGATLGVDGRDDDERFRDLLDRPYRRLREADDRFVMYAVLGNHDWETSREGAMRQRAYLEASPLYHMDGLFYRAEVAPGVELFAMDTTVLLAAETIHEDDIGADGRPRASDELDPEVAWAKPRGAEADMLGWLERALADSDARWKVVIGHHPLWSSSGSKHEESTVLRRLLMPVLCEHADAYLAGHDHTLEVHQDDCSGAGPERPSRPPLLQVVSGAAGKQRPLHTPYMRWLDDAHPQKTTWFAEGLVWGFVELVLDGDTATVHVVTTPDTGSGVPEPRFSRTFERRSGLRGEPDR